jgi:hypothetical protein
MGGLAAAAVAKLADRANKGNEYDGYIEDVYQ